jgi:hypothetical protein
MDNDSTDQCPTIIRYSSSRLPYRSDRGVLVRSISDYYLQTFSGALMNKYGIICCRLRTESAPLIPCDRVGVNLTAQ